MLYNIGWFIERVCSIQYQGYKPDEDQLDPMDPAAYSDTPRYDQIICYCSVGIYMMNQIILFNVEEHGKVD